ncbi:MAG: alanine racemase, partial [Deltaproteobacteria bacterium]
MDLDRLDQNIQALKASLAENFRIVVKSLPSPGLLTYIMEKAGTNRLMVFHRPFLSQIAETFPQSDMLIGKPLPVGSARTFYERFSGTSGFNPSVQLQWLIDTKERLEEYRAIAAELNTKIRINLEIDVGLHRGGLQRPADLLPLVDQILADPEHLEFAGLMGYDPHVVKVPRIIKSPQKAYEQSQFLYQGFLDILKDKYPQIDHSTLCLNGAGSPTLDLHKQGTVVNDISAGS